MTEPDPNATAHADGDRDAHTGGDEATNDTVDVDLDPDEALVDPTDEFDEAPDPDVAEVTDTSDPSYVVPAIQPGTQA